MKDNNQTGFVMNFGALLGGVLLLCVIPVYVFKIHYDTPQLKVLFALAYFFAVIIGIYKGVKKYRDNNLNGYISYWNAVYTGIMICFFASVLVVFYAFLHENYIDAGWMQAEIATYKKMLFEFGHLSNLSDEYMQNQIAAIEETPKASPYSMAISNLFVKSFLGSLAALIISIFLVKKEPQPTLD